MKVLSYSIFIMTFGFQAFAQTTFVEACLGDTKILNSTLFCEVRNAQSSLALDLTLINGEKFQIKPKSLNNYPINFIDLTMQVFYNQAYNLSLNRSGFVNS